MLLNKDGTIIRDIDIDELKISFGHHYGKTIILTKNRITFHNTIHPTIGYMSFPPDYFDHHEIEITHSQFKELSDKIHDAGVLELFRFPLDKTLYPGVVYQSLICTFDDGAIYKYRTHGSPPDAFNRIASILSSFCQFDKLEKECDAKDVSKKESDLFITKCCGAVVLGGWKYCPECGKPSDLQINDDKSTSFDYDQTMWLCESCGEGIPIKYRFCGKCGNKRKW